MHLRYRQQTLYMISRADYFKPRITERKGKRVRVLQYIWMSLFMRSVCCGLLNLSHSVEKAGAKWTALTSVGDTFSGFPLARDFSSVTKMPCVETESIFWLVYKEVTNVTHIVLHSHMWYLPKINIAVMHLRTSHKLLWNMAVTHL